jgi:hypothetical protein
MLDLLPHFLFLTLESAMDASLSKNHTTLLKVGP